MSVTFGEMLRSHRLSAGLTQAGLAERANLSEQAISLLERGTRRRPRTETIQALVDALGLDDQAVSQFTLAAQAARKSRDRTSDVPILLPSAPRQLPPALSDFTGRHREVDLLIRTLTTVDDRPGTVQMAAVTGMGGVGKTSLAVHAAHLAAENFPDGQLYLDVRGYGPGAPLSPGEALVQLLRSLGVDDRTVPEGTNEAAAVYRSYLAGRRLLILLDNANSAGQVIPLLPGTPGSAVIVTSRRALTTLPGFRQISLSPLSDADSVELLARIAGATRVAAEGDAARSIAELTGRLPLAVRLIGARLAARPTWPIEHMVGQLQDEHRRLDEFGTGESGVRANIAGSVEFLAGSDQDLDIQAAAALDLLGLPNGSDLTTITAAHLLDSTEVAAEPVLERLVDLNLLESVAPGRYRLHDLIRAYARERAGQRLSEAAREAALARVLKLYTGMAWRCQELTHPDSRRLAMAGKPGRSLPELPDASTALAWLDNERSNLVGAFHEARQSPALRGYVPELALALFGYFIVNLRWSEMRVIDQVGREVAAELGFDRLAAWLEHDLAIPDVERGELEPSQTHLLRSLELFRAIPDLAGQARCCSSLSHITELMGRLDEAVEWGEQALALSLRIGDQSVEGISYVALGTLHVRRGEHEMAKQRFDLSIALAEKAANLRSLSRRYQYVGQAYLGGGLNALAEQALLKSLDVLAELDDQNAAAETLQHLAANHLAVGDHAAATGRAEAGLQLARANGNKLREGRLLIVLGRIEAVTDDLSAARSLWQQAAALLRPLSPNDESVALQLLTEHED
jgi:transcriptional regulator with XRE-family HTH domain/tetratricopeptide (TPR) repeat protein